MNQSYLDQAVEIAREAGAVIARYFERRIGYELKSEYDLVTEADKQSEKMIVERITARFPGHAVLAEEGGGRENPSEYRWYVDPLDGTTNFAHGFPVFNVSIGLARNGEMIVGVIYDPLRDEMFAAEKGSGAWLNHRRIHVSAVTSLRKSLLATGFPSYKRHLNVNVHYYHQMAMISHGVRRAGSAALDLAYVACGRLDGYWEIGLRPWDMAAGSLIVEEAGGRVTDMTGARLDLAGPHILATNGAIHAEMIEVFQEVAAGRYRVPLPQFDGPGIPSLG
jgi:myo-inositol-1(or 4)-monophosphatase